MLAVGKIDNTCSLCITYGLLGKALPERKKTPSVTSAKRVITGCLAPNNNTKAERLSSPVTAKETDKVGKRPLLFS